MSSTTQKPSILEKPFLLDLLGLMFLFIFLLVAPPLGSDPGIGWHLKTGQWILENRQIPHSDPFLWSTAGREWISNQWLADLIFWIIYKTGGWDALATFCFSLPLVTMLWLQGKILLSASSVKKDLLSPDFLPLFWDLLRKLQPVSFLALSLLVAWVQWISRPVIFSFVLFSILFYWIWSVDRSLSSRSQRNFLFGVFALFVLWANLHSAFPLGMVLLFCAFGSGIIEKNYYRTKLFLNALLLSVVATFLNPYGYKLHANILSLLSEPYFMKLNNEWLSPSFSDSLFFPLVLAFALLLFGTARNHNRKLWVRYVTAIFGVLALRGVRYTPFFGLILPTVFGSHKLEEGRQESSSLISKFIPIGTIISCISVFIFTLFTDLPASQNYSSKILSNHEMWQKVSDECKKMGGKIYNHPDLGGAITFLLNPYCKAGIDDRNELNGVAAYQRFFDISNMDMKVEVNSLPKILILDCKSALVASARRGLQGLILKAEFDRYCILERMDPQAMISG